MMTQLSSMLQDDSQPFTTASLRHRPDCHQGDGEDRKVELDPSRILRRNEPFLSGRSLNKHGGSKGL